MEQKRLDLLHGLLNDIYHADSSAELRAVLDKYADIPEIKSSAPVQTLLEDVRILGNELVLLRERHASDRVNTLSEKEQKELFETNRILDENQFDYHFQPIVNSIDGEIYSFEALMRPRSEICPSPFHIMKYAEFCNRLDDVESITFLNVLGFLDKNKELFGNRRLFINSIPKAQLDDEDYNATMTLLGRNPGCVVMEMTEQSQLNDKELDEINEVYRTAGVETAIDDYGTGYSNIQNLLRYMPQYVKIDRSLMTEIQNNKKKRHFVREIIEFCHENGIKALAEGIETTEELRTVILLGVDLIQGYYTSRPGPDIIDSIPQEIRQEIRQYQQERIEGKKLSIYTAANNERILLDKLARDNFQCVIAGKNGCNNVTFIGSPGYDTNINISVANDFNGTITLENATLSNDNHRPCIDIGENCKVKLVLEGTNKLKKGGIRVPESSQLVCCGSGSLSLYIDGSGYYGIGNDAVSRHGELIFEQGINIESFAATGVCIGSGLGGKIRLIRGQFCFAMHSYIGIGIGALNADSDVEIFACDISMDLSMQTGAAIGSFEDNCALDVAHSALKLYLSGTDIVAIGTVSGESCNVRICESSVLVNMAADNCSAIAALNGRTDFGISKASLHITAKGDNALAIGGYNKNTLAQISNADSSINLITKADYMNFTEKENFEISGGRARIFINDVAVYDV